LSVVLPALGLALSEILRDDLGVLIRGNNAVIWSEERDGAVASLRERYV